MKLFFSILLLTILSVYPQKFYEHQIIPFDGEEWDEFGRSVAICDSFIFIGSPFDDNYTGSIYVYKKEENDWVFWKKLFASDKQEFYRFGTQLFLDGNHLLIGAISTRVNNISSGAVYLFKYEDGDWVEKQKIVPPILQHNGSFSISLYSYENYLVVGSYNYKYKYEYAGRVFLFKQGNNAYNFEQELIPSDPQFIGRFGSSVIMDSTLLLIGSVQDSTSSGDLSGSVYVFKKEDSLWVEKEKYLPDSNSAYLGFGSALAMNSNYVFIGAHGDIGYVGSGSVYIYIRDINNITLIQKINSGENYDFDNFGYPIKINRDSLIIGAYSDTTAGNITGAAYLFIKEGEHWVKQRKFTASDYENANEYGIAIDFYKGNYLIGASESRVNGIRTGKVYLYNDFPVDVSEESFLFESLEFNLFQNYPNPFNPTTSIRYMIKNRGFVSLKIYDILGREVMTLVNEEQSGGEHKINFDGSKLSAGIYFYQLTAGNLKETKKAILMK